MNRVLKTVVISLTLFCMLMIEPVTMLANVKKDLAGEVLNFAPVVDFELKEKKKVDVIVDVGNTAYTMDEVNSLVNQHLRPKLQEAGYDFKLHVEKSYEGDTKLYYYKPAHRSDSGEEVNAGIHEYDTLTRQNQRLQDTYLNGRYIELSGNRWYTQWPYYDPYNKLLIYQGSTLYYKDLINERHTQKIDYFYPNNFNGLSSRIGRSFQFSSNIHYVISQYGYTEVEVSRNSEGAIILEQKSPHNSVSIPTHNDGSITISPLWVTDGKKHVYRWNVNQTSDPYQIMQYEMDNEGKFSKNQWGGIFTRQITNLNAYLNHATADHHVQNSPIHLLPGTGAIIYGLQKNKNAVEGMENNVTNKINALELYNPYTNSYSIVAHNIPYNDNGGGVYTNDGGFITLSDDRLVYNWCSFNTNSMTYTDKECEVRIVDDVERPTAYRVIYRFSLSKNEDSNSAESLAKLPYYIGTVGNKVVFRLGSKYDYAELKLLTMDVDTGEVILVDMIKESANIRALNHFLMFKYPDWYVSKKRYMTDVLDEVPYRSDAEKFYVRIDDQNLAQLSNSKSLVKTINTFSQQQVSYIQIGNDKNIIVSQKLQSALSQDFMHYDIAQIGQSLNQIGKYITDRKEVDLHVLVAQSGQTKAAVESSVQNLVQQLKAENVMVTPHYHFGTSTSRLQQLYNNVSWNEENNQYVLFLNTAAMNELTDADYLEGAVFTLLSNYAHYLQIGSSTNRSIAESIIAMNESKGKFYNGTSYSSYYADMKQYILDTALKSPKRVNDVLVLQRDPVTNEYSAEINVNLFYDDFESDRKRNERFKTTQDPTVYENHTGLMDGIGQYQDAPTTRFTKVGLYEMTMQAQDEPIANAAFNEYWKWSQDSLSMLRLYVHRAPVAKFSAVVRPNKTVNITDYSYDLDRYSRLNRGIVEWEWKWKKLDDTSWTAGQLTQLANNTDYLISLRVKDIDGAWSNEAIQFVSSNPFNNPPVALFTIDPANVSHRANATIRDLSFDPDGDAIIKREWVVKKDNVEIWNQTRQPTKAQLQTAATSRGLNQLGQYQLSLRVTDALGELSDWHTEWMEVINYPPLAAFEDLVETDRDSLNRLMNTTAEPDQDGDPVSYTWTLHYKDRNFALGTSKNPQFTIKNYGLGKAAVGMWEVTLQARDPLGASSTLTKSFEVINHAPIARIASSPPYAYIDENYSFTSNDTDPDSEDRASLTYYWSLTPPSGKKRSFTTKDVTNIMFDEKGLHVMEHWAEDQLGARSEVAKVQFNVLNKRPVADFTRSPITTYRGIDIAFKSLATDYDGWIETYRYELMRESSSPLTLSTEADFERSFSSIGTYDIRHTVTDNDGASDSITKKVYIVNRAPRAEVTQPSGTSKATATEFNTLTPTIRWTMTDADNDAQVQYQLQLKNESGTVLRTTPITSTVNKYYTLPSGWLAEGPIYRVAVRVFDGYDWSEYSADKYFYVQLNRPPVPGFSYSPTVVYEGDTITIRHQVSDPDLDTLSVRYMVTAPNGQISYYPSATGNYMLTSSQYNSDAFTLTQVMPGRYTIEQTVSDLKADPVKLVRTIDVGALSIVGQVAHTEQWESHRIAYNASLPANSTKQWLPLQFYSGERFMLLADTTLAPSAASGSTTYARHVTAKLLTTETTVELSYEQGLRWSGSMWEERFSSLARGTHTIEFEVHYSNGVIKQHTVDIEIIGKASDLAGVQRWK